MLLTFSPDLGPVGGPSLVKRNKGFDYRSARFKDALHDDCSFYAMLTWLHRRAILQGDIRTAAQSLYFKGECLKIMSQRLNDWDSASIPIADGTIFGALDLSNAEVSYPSTLEYRSDYVKIRFGDIEVARLHWRGLRRIIISKGGLVNIVSKAPLIHSLVW